MKKENVWTEKWQVHIQYMQKLLESNIEIDRETFLKHFIGSPTTRGRDAYKKDGYAVDTRIGIEALWNDSKHAWAGMVGSTFDDLFPGGKIPEKLREFHREVSLLNAKMGHNRELLEHNMDEPPSDIEIENWHS